jgi:hypothetical protein
MRAYANQPAAIGSGMGIKTCVASASLAARRGSAQRGGLARATSTANSRRGVRHGAPVKLYEMMVNGGRMNVGGAVLSPAKFSPASAALT